MKEVSRALLMEDPAYFNRMFKKATGMTPVEYRTHIREKYKHYRGSSIDGAGVVLDLCIRTEQRSAPRQLRSPSASVLFADMEIAVLHRRHPVAFLGGQLIRRSRLGIPFLHTKLACRAKR